ncbi:hypothetical protein FPOAC1_004108 [Fusarium poae]|uniref:hypothetical protein n=1 Tax=Fusarium poae TaxID=36050 RepID=UPI001CE8CEE5|nr:hypothetical protein FPOAC1_004108 [Fusarium poae]KAG8670874.1 hypothetical protein FPOAC1_004108 [Fusarium poae]
METETNSIKWRVANYQIPVPIGDCSAHFLIKMKDEKVEKIEKAFLMDGGTNAGGYYAWVQILKGLRHIDLELGTNWKFDNWVVTHWDEDHYRGVRDLLSSDLKLFRFIQRGENVPTARSQSSTFAKQYFCDEPWLLCGALDLVMFFNRKKEQDISFLKPFMDEPRLYVAGIIKALFDKAYELNNTYCLNNESSRLIIKSARLRCITTQPLVGVDLFTRTRQFNPDGTICSESHKTFSGWGIDHDPKTPQPRFCVIGADGYGIGVGDGERVVPEPSRNETSILGILYWPENGRCSYYTGGDGSPIVAKDIVDNWLSKSGYFNKHGHGLVDLMKLDHHGSTRENLGSKKETGVGTNSLVAEVSNKTKKKAADIITDTLIEKLKPQGLLVTPGTQHGHPTWDVLLALYKYFSGFKQADGLFTTRSFYWLDANKPLSIKDLNFNHNEIGYMRAVYDTVWDSYHPAIEIKNVDDQVPTDDIMEHLQAADGIDYDTHHAAIEIEYVDGQVPNGEDSHSLEEVYQNIHARYLANNKQDNEDEEATLYDLYVLDQKVRMELQAEFKIQRYRYGKWLEEKKKPGISKNSKIIWGKVQELLTEECQRLQKLSAMELDKALKKSSTHGVDAHIFWAWHNWAWHVEDSLLDGAVQYSDVCWQPIISDGNPHFLISFVFDKDGEDRCIEVFTDDGEYQFIHGTQDVSRTPTNLFVQDKDAKWPELVYTPLTLATIFDLSGPDNQNMFKNYTIVKQALVGHMRQMKLAVDVLFNTKPVDPKQSKASSKSLIKSAKLRVAKLDETIAKYHEMSLAEEHNIADLSKEGEPIAMNRTPRTRKSDTFVPLDPKNKEELISKIYKALLKLAYHSDMDLTEALLHEQICYFAWHYMSKVTRMRDIILLVWDKNYDGAVVYDEIQEDAMLRTVDFLLSNFKLGTFFG